MNSLNATRRSFLLRCLAIGAAVTSPILVLAQEGTPGMKRRQRRRDDRTDRLQKRDEKQVARRDDPIGVRGPQRREDRRELRTDRRTDRRERVY